MEQFPRFGKDSPARIVVAIVATGSGNERSRVDDQGAPNPSRSRNSSASRPLMASEVNDPMNSKGSTSLASLSRRCASTDGSMPSRSARSASSAFSETPSSVVVEFHNQASHANRPLTCRSGAVTSAGSPEAGCALATLVSAFLRRSCDVFLPVGGGFYPDGW